MMTLMMMMMVMVMMMMMMMMMMMIPSRFVRLLFVEGGGSFEVDWQRCCIDVLAGSL